MPNNTLTRLRDLLFEDPHPAAWAAIVEAIDASPTPGDRGLVVEYVAGHLDAWPDELRAAPEDWWHARQDDEPVVGWELVRCLDLSHNRYRTPRAKRFLKSKHMRDLPALLLAGSNLTSQGLISLAHNKNIDHLTTLDISNNPIRTVRGLAPLIDSKNLLNLKTLRLRNNDLKSNAIAELVNALLIDNVTELDLSGNRLLIAGTRAVVNSNRLQHLQALWIEDAGMSDKTARLFARASNLPALRRLHAGRNNLGPGGLAPLAAGPLLAQLEQLDVSHNGLGPADVDALLGRAAANLVRVDLAHNTVGDTGCQRLAEAQRLDALRRLDLRANVITSLGALALATAPWLHQLERLDLRGNAVEPDGRQALLHALGPRAAEVLRLDAPDTSRPTFDPAPAHARLAEACAASPDLAAWDAVTVALDAFPDGHALQSAIDHAADALAAWPAELRELPNRWWTRLRKHLPEPRARLARQLTVFNHDASRNLADLLTHAPDLTSLERLRLVQCPLTPTACATLAASPRLAHLRDLELDRCALSLEAIEAFADGIDAPNLRRLRLAHTSLPAPALASLLRRLTALETLELDGDALDAHALGAFARADLPNLRHLNLDANHLDLSQWPDAPTFPALLTLRWRPAPLQAHATVFDVVDLAAPRGLERLQHLRAPSLTELAIDGAALPALAAGPERPHLRHLTLTAPVTWPASLAALAAVETLGLQAVNCMNDLPTLDGLFEALGRGDLPNLRRFVCDASFPWRADAFFRLTGQVAGRPGLTATLPTVVLGSDDVQRFVDLPDLPGDHLDLLLDTHQAHGQLHANNELLISAGILSRLRSFGLDPIANSQNQRPGRRQQRRLQPLKLRSPLRNLRRLALVGGSVNIDNLLMGLIREQALSHLEELDLHLAGWGNAEFAFHISQLQSLRRLSLRADRANFRLSQMLFNGFETGVPPLESLELLDIDLSALTANLLQPLDHAHALRTLSLRGCLLHEGTIARLAETPGLALLQRVDLRDCRVSPRELHTLLTTTTLRNLTEVVTDDISSLRDVWWEGNVRHVLSTPDL